MYTAHCNSLPPVNPIPPLARPIQYQPPHLPQYKTEIQLRIFVFLLTPAPFSADTKTHTNSRFFDTKIYDGKTSGDISPLQRQIPIQFHCVGSLWPFRQLDSSTRRPNTLRVEDLLDVSPWRVMMTQKCYGQTDTLPRTSLLDVKINFPISHMVDSADEFPICFKQVILMNSSDGCQNFLSMNFLKL